MPLKIRCPHCRNALIAEDFTIGEERLCPKCAAVFTVPIPYRDEFAAACPPGAPCAHCGQDLAPGTSLCPACRFDAATGRRPTRAQRAKQALRSAPLAAWLGVAALIIGGVAAAQYARWSWRSADRPVVMAPASAPSAELYAEAAQALLAACSADGRAQALHGLAAGGEQAAEALVDALAAQSQRSGLSVRRDEAWILNRLAAIEFFARSGYAPATPLLADLQRQAALSESALCARASLGDAAVLPELHERWRGALRALTLADGLMNTARGDPSAFSAARSRLHTRLTRYTRALQALCEVPESGVVATVLRDYWPSWGWLGQDRGESLAAAAFDVARGRSGDSLQFDEVKGEIRGARNRLDALASSTTAELSVATAAAVTLVSQTPQYRRAAQRATAALAGRLASARGVDQGRLVWALTRLTGQAFATFDERRNPTTLSAGELTAASAWAVRAGLANSDQRIALAAQQPLPRLRVRVVPVARQHEQRLLAAVAGNWAALESSAIEWQERRLGFTPRLLDAMHPGQSAPDGPLMALAIEVAAQERATAARPALELWGQASDQPGWLRGAALLAYTVIENQPERTAAAIAQFDSAGLEPDHPAWLWLTRLLRAGSDSFVDAARRAGGSLSPAARDTLRRLPDLEDAARAQDLGK